MTIRVGILRTDAVLDEFQDTHGDYPAMFERLLGDIDASLEFTSIDARASVPDALDCDAYLITGSRHSVYDDLPWIGELVDFLRSALAAGKRIIGICFGHQLLAHHFGGEVRPADQGWAVGVHASQVIAPQSWMSDSEDGLEFALLSSHKDQVQRLPHGAQLYARNDFCPLAGFVIGDQVMTIQGHPEFTKPYSQALMGYREAILGPEVYAQGVQSLEQDTHETRFAEWVVRFLRAPSTASKTDD